MKAYKTEYLLRGNTGKNFEVLAYDFHETHLSYLYNPGPAIWWRQHDGTVHAILHYESGANLDDPNIDNYPYKL